MKITSLLIASAAAVVAASSAQAADAIVAAEPEALEYVRVCDSFGTGYFYIPGTETCLKIGGYARFQVNINDGTGFGTDTNNRTSDWDATSRGQIGLTAKSDTDLGELTSVIVLQGNATSDKSKAVVVDEAYIALGGFQAGYFWGWWDNGIAGEVDTLGNMTISNSVRYTYDAGSFQAGLAVDELEGYGKVNNGVGVTAYAGAKFGGVSVDLLAGFDTDNDASAYRAIVGAEVGPGTLGLAAVYATSAGAYFDASKWTVAASYAVKVTDKLTITPGIQYFDDVKFAKGVDQWDANLTLDYAITAGLSAKASLTYSDTDGKDDVTKGFLRLQRSF